MKRVRLVLLSALFVALSVIAWESKEVLFFLMMDAMEPTGSGCDEGPVTDNSATNTRGDVVEEYIKACTQIGTFVDYSIVLQRHGAEKTTTLAEYDDAQYDYPKFQWIDDDTLVIDLGEVRSVWSQVDKIGSIHITYVYTETATGWW
ncbi:MAG TPA: hypothetical protein VLZ74_12695 [Methylocella sp.]|nr:hypothetical protein [Methylocella sp.]